MKKLYFPGTDIVVGCLYKDRTMFLDMKYYPDDLDVRKLILMREEQPIQLSYYTGWYKEITKRIYMFNDCYFKIPDNLDLIEAIHFHKNDVQNYGK